MKESKACDRYPELYIKYKQGKKPNIFYDDPATGQETNVDISDWTTEEIDNWFLSRDFKQVGEIPNEDEIKKQTEKDEEDTQKWAADAKRRMDESIAKAREMQQELDKEAKNEPKQEPAQSEGSQPDAEQPIDTDKAEL